MQKKQRLIQFLSSARLLTLLAPLAGNTLIVFNYHRIRPDDPGFTTPFDESVYGPTVSDFAAQLEWLKKYRRVLSEDELLDLIQAKHRSFRRCVLITFDDGYRDNFTLAYPVLEALDIPATFFISTHLISSRQLGWWDIIAYLVKRSTRQTITFEGATLPLQNHRQEIIRFMAQKMKLQKQETTHDLVTRLAEACAVDLPPHALQDSQLMTWDQIRVVSQGVITIGSHTHTHRVLATLDTDAQQDELATSKAILETHIAKPVRAIAYPVGGTRHFTKETQRLAESAGYKLAYSYRTGLNHAKTPAAFDIKRTSGPIQPSMVPAVSIFPRIFVEHEDESRYQMDFSVA
ncbi:MAG: polysaccharide deacetylase family protein [Caldilineaceae bacterium]|nr:polysaccharide deacetylase family protein [Caldilineaceae bacterium]